MVLQTKITKGSSLIVDRLKFTCDPSWFLESSLQLFDELITNKHGFNGSSCKQSFSIELIIIHSLTWPGCRRTGTRLFTRQLSEKNGVWKSLWSSAETGETFRMMSRGVTRINKCPLDRLSFPSITTWTWFCRACPSNHSLLKFH